MNTASAPVNSASARYHPVSVLLHWVLGLALIAIFALGIYMHELPFSPQRLKLYNWHKWAGITVLTLSFVRLFWRLLVPPPALPQSMVDAMPAWQHMAHKLTHVGLYLLFFAVPLVGWAYSSAAGFQVVLFGVLPLPDFVPTSEGLADVLKEAHEVLAFAMAALVLLHVAGAVKHQVIDRDGLMSRMGFGRS
ncbi:cytochrome b [Hydrogenophaga sp. 5NK40-0174]|uniref:cytochrome b n=1 Tax=Hydrogenophaga sp. 5NK40-0174 TaxID=3127649 RepID=UPI003104A335